MNYNKRIHGFTIVLESLRRQLWDEAFMAGIHNVLVEAAGSPKENPVLLGSVSMCNNLPKWFPFRVQYVFAGCEYVVGKLWLIANNQRCIFVVEAHAHDLATLYARYSLVFENRKTATREAPVVTNAEPLCEPSPTT